MVRTFAAISLALLGILVAVAPTHATGTSGTPPWRANATPKPTATPTPIPMPSPERMLFLIRRQFRSHRPPPPYVTYTLVRKQTLDDGFPDLVNSYTYHIWCRSTDRAAL